MLVKMTSDQIRLIKNLNKMKILFLIFLIFLPFNVFSDEAFKGERRYFCLVDDFKTRGDENLKFIEENKKKSFLLIINKSEIFVKSFSDYFTSSEDIYKIIENKNINKNSITGVSSDGYTFETFFFDELTRYGNITKHLHFSFITWLISCKRDFELE